MLRITLVLLAACGGGPGAVTVLAKVDGVQRVLLVGDDVITVDIRGGVTRIAKTGGTPTVIAQARGAIDDFIVIDSEIFFTQTTGTQGFTDVKHMHIDGSGVETLASSVQRGTLRSNGDALFFYDRSSDTAALVRMGKSGGKPDVLLALGSSMSSELTVDTAFVYYRTADDGIHRVPTSGGASAQFLPKVSPTELTSDADALYYLDADTAGIAALWRAPKTGTAPVPLLRQSLARYALSEKFIIFTSLSLSGGGRQTLGRANRDGTVSTTLITNLGTLTLVQPTSDDTAAYWGDGSVLKKFPYSH